MFKLFVVEIWNVYLWLDNTWQSVCKDIVFALILLHWYVLFSFYKKRILGKRNLSIRQEINGLQSIGLYSAYMNPLGIHQNSHSIRNLFGSRLWKRDMRLITSIKGRGGGTHFTFIRKERNSQSWRQKTK